MGEFEETGSLNVSETEQTPEVSDADLDAAFQEFMGIEEPIPQTVETEVDAEVETEITTVTHPESSRLGRKVRRIEESMVSKDDFRNLTTKLETLMEQMNRKPVVPEYDDYGNVIEKPVDIDSIVEQKIVQRETRREQAQRVEVEKYQKGYLDTMRDLIEEVEDPVIARDIWKKMTVPGSEFNVKHSDNPYTDCSKNFLKAVKSVKTPFGGKRGSTLPTGVTTTTVSGEPLKKVPKLDPEAEEFIRMTGMKEEDIMSALEGEIPNRLRRG